ncbi:hypothetical protein VSK91_19670 [Bacillus swezeyi]|uniref:hypothetical protein n=1 Tax=Bacillus swezeyi TaxID=1925020 RepID=UPI0039C7017A
MKVSVLKNALLGLLIIISIAVVIHIYYFVDSKFSTEMLTKLSAIGTTAAAFGGLALLLVTYGSYTEVRRQRIALEEPAVTVKAVTDPENVSCLNLELKNTGGGQAYDISVKFSPDIPYGKTTLNDINMFKRTALLEKGEVICFFFDNKENYKRSQSPIKSKVTISYYTSPKENRGAKKIVRSYEIDFQERNGTIHLVKRNMNDLVNQVEDLKHVLAAIYTNERNKND